jgi:hypothetical protein
MAVIMTFDSLLCVNVAIYRYDVQKNYSDAFPKRASMQDMIASKCGSAMA